MKAIDWYQARRKEKVEVGKSLNELVDRRIAMALQDDELTIKRQSEEINVLRARHDRLENYVQVLIGAMVKAGISVPPITKD